MGSFVYAESGLPVMRKCIECKEITPLSDGGNDILCEACWEIEGEKLAQDDMLEKTS